ncbi:MAG: class II aldolase/adducin family protein [Butyricicoccus sp.]|nr:class II aldolase/adducin family protein [Butyricicoccus sp.]
MSLKSEIIEAGQRLYQAGLVASNDGNISARCPDGSVWCTPSGVSKGFMSEDMLIRTDLDGNVLESGDLKPSSEIKMHLAIYRENPEIMAVVHAHPPAAATFASAGLPLDSAILQETVVQLGVVPLAPYALPGSAELAGSVAPYCRGYNAALMEYHGATSWGDSVMQALHRMESVEYYAKILMNLRVMRAERPMTAEQIDGLLSLRHGWGVKGGGRPRGIN